MNKHFFFDGYDIKTETLMSVDKMRELLTNINKLYFNKKGNIVLIPYFNGKIKQDGGVSGIVFGDNSHFTCHTFCYKNTLFADYYGKKEYFDNVEQNIIKIYPTNDIDLCNESNNTDGNFGKHLIFNQLQAMTYGESLKIISQILNDIEMTPINNIITNYKDDKHFDIIQPIAESHVAIHRSDNNTTLDIFSCKWFDEEKVMKLLKSGIYDKVRRGVKYK